jgi:hypothetical protein
MDPFSLTIGILSAVDIASRVATGITGFLKDARHASAERELLAKEAASLLILLENVRDRVRQGSFDSDAITHQTALVKQFKADCEELASTLGFDPSTESLKLESRFRELRTATKWVSSKKEVYAILERISRIEQHANTLLLSHQRSVHLSTADAIKKKASRYYTNLVLELVTCWNISIKGQKRVRSSSSNKFESTRRIIDCTQRGQSN